MNTHALTSALLGLVLAATAASAPAQEERRSQPGGGRQGVYAEILGKYKADHPAEHAKLMKLRQTDRDAFRKKVGEVIRAAAEKDPELRKRLRGQTRQPGRTGAATPFKVPDTVKVERDIVYAKYGKREVKLDLYLPKAKADGKLPCIMVVHGGGWRSGDKNRFARFASAFAEKGLAAACIGYRLRPLVQVRQCVEDAKAATRWVRANAAKYHIDPELFGAFGGSAGAHLVAMLGTSFKEKKLEGAGGNEGVSSRVHAVVALATPADLTAFGRLGGDKAAAKLISPAAYVDADSATFLLMHAKGDRVVPHKQSTILTAKLAAANVKVKLITLDSGSHAFWNGTGPAAKKALADAIEFFQKTLKAKKAK